jgi:hypothetical protein
MVEDFTPAGNGSGAHGTAADRLNSWKEIAAYLGKGVRTVQRWEGQMGLPVRRLGREGGEIVYALKSEIDAWILNGGHAAESKHPHETSGTPREAAPPELPKAEPHAPGLSHELVPPPSSAVPRFAAPRWAWSIVILIFVSGIGMSHVQRKGVLRAQTVPNPVGAAFEGGFLHAWGSDGSTLWRTPIAAAPETRLDTRMSDPTRDWRRIAVEDLDGDGANEVLLIVRSPSGSGDSLRVFNADGVARFSHVAGRPVTFGSEAYPGFNTNSFFVFRDADGDPSLWVTAAHVSFFPSLLQRISSRGEVLSEYWSNGHIRTVRPALVRGHPFLLVGAYNNERHGASLAFLDLDHPSGTAPAEKPYYRCRDCADGEPSEFLVFPGADILNEATQSQGSATVQDARLTGPNDMVVTVFQTSSSVPGEARALEGTVNYMLSMADLSLTRLLPGWSYLAIHKTYERAGRMNHAFGPKDEADLAHVVRWSRGRFAPLKESAGDPVFARVRETAAIQAGS